MERLLRPAAPSGKRGEFASGCAEVENAHPGRPPSAYPGNFILGRTFRGNFSLALSSRPSQVGRGQAGGAGRRGQRGSPGRDAARRVPPSPLGAPGRAGRSRREATHQPESEEDGEQGEAGAHDDEKQKDDERVLLAHAVVRLVEPVPGPLQPVAVAAAACRRRRRRLGAVPKVAAPPHRLLPHRGGSRGARRARPAGAAPPASPQPPASQPRAASAGRAARAPSCAQGPPARAELGAPGWAR